VRNLQSAVDKQQETHEREIKNLRIELIEMKEASSQGEDDIQTVTKKYNERIRVLE